MLGQVASVHLGTKDTATPGRRSREEHAGRSTGELHSDPGAATNALCDVGSGFQSLGPFNGSGGGAGINWKASGAHVKQ